MQAATLQQVHFPSLTSACSRVPEFNFHLPLWPFSLRAQPPSARPSTHRVHPHTHPQPRTRSGSNSAFALSTTSTTPLLPPLRFDQAHVNEHVSAAVPLSVRSLPNSPVASPPMSPVLEEQRARIGVKRKRSMSVPSAKPTHKQPKETKEVKSEVTFPNGAQVATWKLNGSRYKRCRVTSSNGVDTEWKRCQHCGTDTTPEWRTGPLGKGTLCNACGLRYRSKQKEHTTRRQTGNLPMSFLLNPESGKKGRTNISNPMIWETKLASFPASGTLVD